MAAHTSVCVAFAFCEFDAGRRVSRWSQRTARADWTRIVATVVCACPVASLTTSIKPICSAAFVRGRCRHPRASAPSWSTPRPRPPAHSAHRWRSLSPSGPWRTCVRVTTSSPYESCRTNEPNTISERGHGTTTNDSGYNPGPVRARGSLRPSGDAAACIKCTEVKCNADACVRRHVEAHHAVPVTHVCCSPCLRPVPAARR